MLKWLIPSDQAIDYDADLESDRTKAVDNTCTWIFGTDEYEDWMSTELSKICWVHGIPGCGKSTLVASTCRSVSEDHGQVVHFFFRPDSSFSAAFALSCLTHQMLYMSDTVFEALRPKYEKTRAPTVQSHTTATAVFKIALKAFGDCIIFLDALDNCKDRGALLNVLTQLVVEMPFGIKIFCSSRDEHDILRTLSDSPSVLEIPVSKDKIKQEISTFIRITVNQNADLIEKLKDHPEALEYIISQLCDGAQGMFLLPKYFIEDLSAMTDIEQMYNFMNDLPRDVQSYYLQIVSGMDSRYWNLARKVFTWTAWARRPLSLAELDQVLCIDHPDYLSLRQDIKRALGCLVTLENDLVRLSHDSVRRFVLESSAFKSSQIYRHLVPSKPGDDIAEACAKFVFMGTYKRPASPDHRFAGQRAALFRETCPFLEYASYNWVFHWSMTSKPLRLLPSVVRFFESYQLLDWVESVGHFLISEGFETIISTLRNFLVKLQLGIQRRHKVKDDLIRAWLHLFRLRKISGRLSKLSTFLNSWDATIRNFPDEIHILAPLLETSFSAHKLQDVLITRHPQRTDSAKLYNLLDSLTLPRSYDRFMLSDLHIFMWQSLMPSIPWNLSYVPLDPQRPEKIQLTSISITTSIPHGREGKDPAEVGSITVTTTLRKDLRVVGISWARFSEDKSQPLAIKSYAWSLAEDPRTAILYPFSWSHLGDDDPCRVDITITHAFRMSKCALAFTDDLQTMWTAGGTYNIRTGYHRPAPRLFTNSRMRALTFSRNCAIIAGVRDSQFLEIYDLPRLCRIAPPLCCIASYKGDCTLLGVSPLGKFVLFLEKLDCDDPAPDLLETPRPSHYAVSLLSHSGTRTVIWTDEQFSEARRQSPSRSPSPDRKPFSLEEYYNSGGLHAFSQNDTVLVLCVPASPDWELLGFDLQTSDIRNSCWSIEYSSILLGAGITSISFCPIHERRLYLLDSYCVMRSFEIVRSDVTSGSQISTVEGEDLPPVWTLIPQTSEKPVVTITLAQE
jgi:NACHT domain